MVVTALATAAIGGCKPQEDDGSLSPAEARFAGDALGNSIELAAGSYGPMDEGTAVTAVTAADACITMTGDTSDPDLDSIPTNAVRTFNCSATLLGFTGTLTGTETMTDDQPTQVAWAFTAASDLHAILTRPAGSTAMTMDVAGQVVATQDTAIGPFNLGRDLAVVTVFSTDAGGSTTVDEAADWTISFRPQLSWTAGAPVVTGSLTAAGLWTVSVGAAAAAEATLSTPTPLTLDPACATAVTAGSVVAAYTALERSHSLTVTWTGCGAHVVTHQ